MKTGEIYKVGGIDPWSGPCPDKVTAFITAPEPLLATAVDVNKDDLVTIFSVRMAFRDISSVEVLHPVHGICHISSQYLTAA